MKALLSILLILAAVVVVHGDALQAPFFADDYLFLDQVADVSLTQAVTTPDAIGNYYRPVSRQGWFWALSRMGGGEPGLFHLANLSLLLLSLALLGYLTWSMAGPVAAAIAIALVGLHEATDVATRWASASQELLAVAGSLATIVLYRAGARIPAAIMLFVALLSKETAVVTPLLAVLVDRKPDEPFPRAFQRAAPLLVSVVVAFSLWLIAVTRSHAAPEAGASLSLGGIAAAIVHILHLAIGLEWGRSGHLPSPPSTVLFVVLPLILGALWWLWPARSARRNRYGAGTPSANPARAVGIGFVWMLIAALPVAAAASLWSSYQYLLALCGAAIALGAFLSRAPRAAALVAVGAILISTDQARRAGEFASERSPWTFRSHVNRAYIDRANADQVRMIANLKHARPELPPNSTLYFDGIPDFVGFQVGDGPLVRWAYRDRTVRAYFATEFSESRAKRGPNFFFVADDGHLRELRRPDEVRDLAVGIVYADRLDAGRDALRHLLRKNSRDRQTRYWLAWVELARGDRAEAERHLGVLGHQVVETDSVFLTEAPPRDATYSNWKDWLAWRRSPYKAFQDVDKLLAAGDTTGATGVLERAVEAHAMMAEVHAHRADLALMLRDYETAAVEAFATRSLAPEAPRAWRRWASIMLLAERPEQARLALERYFELAPERRDRDREATRLLEKLRRVAAGEAVALEAGRKPGTSSQEL